jgi:hypothetical protein
LNLCGQYLGGQCSPTGLWESGAGGHRRRKQQLQQRSSGGGSGSSSSGGGRTAGSEFAFYTESASLVYKGMRAGGRLALANSHTADTAVSSKNQGRIPAALYPGRQLDDSLQNMPRRQKPSEWLLSRMDGY